MLVLYQPKDHQPSKKQGAITMDDPQSPLGLI